jgi:hypothetical protein
MKRIAHIQSGSLIIARPLTRKEAADRLRRYRREFIPVRYVYPDGKVYQFDNRPEENCKFPINPYTIRVLDRPDRPTFDESAPFDKATTNTALQLLL